MKVFSVRLYCPTLFSTIGGAEKFTAMIAQYLVKTFKELDLGLVAQKAKYARMEDNIDFLNQNYGLSFSSDINIQFLKEETPGLWNRYAAHRELRKTSRNVDLYINCFHNVQFFYGKKNVHIIHFPANRRIVASPTFSRIPLLKPIAYILDKKYEKCYNLFICNSLFTEAWLERYWNIAPERKIVLNPPATYGSIWSLSIEEKKENIILLVSRFDKRKNILEGVTYFCEHENLFPNWRLIVAGYCNDKDKEYYDRVAQAAQGHRVEVKVNLSGLNLEALYKKAKIFWHVMGLHIDENTDPLNVEHFGITTVEAMAAGAVPVVIDKGGQREIVDDGINGFRWKTLEELGRLTQRLIMDTDLRLAMSKAAVEKSNTYSIEAFNANIDTIFREHNLIPAEYRR